jgi:ABC-2 type transport system ATP-binding protein
MIEAELLEKRFGPTLAVDGVSFAVERGEVVAFLGPNGAGKSTTLRMIAGVLEPDAGRAMVAGLDFALNRREAQAYLGYLPEGAPAYPAMTPRGFVRFHLRARGFSGAGLRHAEARALELARLGSYAERPIGALSKGYKRRAALAAAIAHDPPVLILDEPTDGLDPNQKDGVRDLIAEMAPKKAILISTHLLDEVDAMCSRAVVIAGGRITADDTPVELALKGPDGTLGGAFRALTAAAERVEDRANLALSAEREGVA